MPALEDVIVWDVKRAQMVNENNQIRESVTIYLVFRSQSGTKPASERKLRASSNHLRRTNLRLDTQTGPSGYGMTRLKVLSQHSTDIRKLLRPCVSMLPVTALLLVHKIQTLFSGTLLEKPAYSG